MTNTETTRIKSALETTRQELIHEIDAQTAELAIRDGEHDPIDHVQTLTPRNETVAARDRLSGVLADVDESLRAISNACDGLGAERGEPVALKQLEARAITDHHAFYEVLPYYVVIEEGHGTPAATSRRIQAGFDIDIYAARMNDGLEPPPGYALGYRWLENIAETISHQTTDSCSIEAISFPSTIFFDTRNHLQGQAMLRIRVSHYRGLDQPAGQPEQRALEEIEKEFQNRGLVRG